MALSKIIEISNIGRLVECKNIELWKVNLIYAENGCGKSTLSAILRALPGKVSSIIDERRTLGSNKKPKVKLLFNNTDFFSYVNTQWKGDSPHFEIFDDIFVSENIYAGHEINSDQRAGLYEFAIGSLAVDLRNTEKNLDEQIQVLRNKCNELRKTIGARITIDFEEFIGLPNVDKLDENIKTVEDYLRAAQLNASIQEQQSLMQLDELQIDFDVYRQLLSKTIDDVSHDAETFVKQHIADHMNSTNTENWLEAGLDLIKDENCPFCGQSLNHLNVVKLYKDYFNKQYKLLKDEIASAITNIKDQVSDSNLLNIQRLLSRNQELANIWAEYISERHLHFDFDNLQLAWQRLRIELVVLLERKQESPLEPIGDDFANIFSSHRQIVAHVQNYNRFVIAINELVTEFKSRLADADIVKLQLELAKLQHTQKRYNELKADCEEYQSLVTKRSALDEERRIAKNNLDQENARILQKYQVDINNYLDSFGVDYRIKNDIDRRGTGTPRIVLKVVINNEDVNTTTSASGVPSFKTTLSTGDKTTLALAFFFAKLKQVDQAKLLDTIVVLDDPITSLDHHRRDKTINEIVSLEQRAQQLIILSHDAYFLRNLCEKLSYNSKKRKLLQLTSREKQTNFIEWQMKETVNNRYYRLCKEISDFIERGSEGDIRKLEAVKNNIRIVLETALESRFPTELLPSNSLGKHIASIKGCDSQSALNILKNDASQMQTLDELNAYSEQIHHSDGNDEGINERELRVKARSLMDFVNGRSK